MGAEPATDILARRRAPLRSAVSTPALRRCQLAPAVARLVDMAALVAVSVHLYSTADPSWVAAFVAVRTLAPALGTPLVMAAAGRRSGATALAVAAGTATLSFATTAVVVSAGGSPLAIVVLGGVAGIALYCLRPLTIALLPCHIGSPSQLVATNSMAALLDNASTLGGPLLAAAATATVGAPAALWACTGLLAIAAITTRGIGGPRRPTVVGGGGGARDVAAEAVAGLRTLTGCAHLRLIASLSVAQTFVRGAVSVLVVSLAIDRLDMGEGGVGVLLGAIGVGGMVGLPVAVRVADAGRLGRSLGLALVLWGTPIALLATTDLAWAAVLLFAVVGIGNDLVDISSDTLLQRLVPKRSLSAALGAFDAVLYAGMGLGAIAAQALATRFGVEGAIVAVGVFLPALALLAWLPLTRMDAAVRSQDDDVALLRVHGIFTPMVMSTIDHLAETMRHEVHEAGATIIRKGDVGDRFFLIERGTVEIVDEDEHLALLGPGDVFGEMALLDDVPRNATALADTDVVVRSVDREAFLVAVRSHGASHDEARRLADSRRRETLARTGTTG